MRYYVVIAQRNDGDATMLFPGRTVRTAVEQFVKRALSVLQKDHERMIERILHAHSQFDPELEMYKIEAVGKERFDGLWISHFEMEDVVAPPEKGELEKTADHLSRTVEGKLSCLGTDLIDLKRQALTHPEADLNEPILDSLEELRVAVACLHGVVMGDR